MENLQELKAEIRIEGINEYPTGVICVDMVGFYRPSYYDIFVSLIDGCADYE